MDNVRKAASVSGSQLAHYFANKQALIRAIIAHQIDVVLDFHRQPKLQALDTFDDFERWIDLNMRYLRRIGYSGNPTYHALAGSSRSPTMQLGRRWPRATGSGSSCWSKRSSA
jgi:AcrR family transcriptional regulator